jgi:GNAT superfamily N-acetyltransferase
MVFTGAQMTDGTIRRARPEDVAEILAMVHDLATYEKALAALFGEEPKVFAHVVEHRTGGHELGGFALWFLNFSTWLGKHGVYLEDLYVRPELRGSGYGKRLLATLAQECVDNDYGRLEWWVLDWNRPSRDFYEAHGANALTEWTPYRVTGADLHTLARAGDDPTDTSDLDAG